jgi:hypothetical protein
MSDRRPDEILWFDTRRGWKKVGFDAKTHLVGASFDADQSQKGNLISRRKKFFQAATNSAVLSTLLSVQKIMINRGVEPLTLAFQTSEDISTTL